MNTRFMWSVQRFDTLPIMPDASLLSPRFYVHNSKAAEFCLRIQAEQFPSTAEECVGRLFLCRCDNDGPENVEVEYNLSFGRHELFLTHRQKFSKPQHGALYQSYETDSVQIKKDCMPPDTLHIKCEILSYTDDRCETSEVGDKKDLEDLSQAFTNLFKFPIFSDDVIRTQNRVFNIHKAVLDARCPGLLEECQLKRFRETEYEEYTIEKLLFYIYTGKFQCENIPDDLYLLLKKCNVSVFDHLCLPFLNLMHTRTSFKVNYVYARWTIENFLSFSYDKEFCHKIIDNNPITWFKAKFFVFECPNDIMHLRFVLEKMCKERNVFVQCSIYVAIIPDTRLPVFQGSHLLTNEHSLQVNLDHQISLIRSKLNYGSAVFDIEIGVTDGVPVNSMTCLKGSTAIACPQNIIRPYELGYDIGKLYLNSQHADVILTVNDKSIPAHKAILCARSPVFLRMFQQNICQTEVPLNNLDENVAFALIHYMYSAQVVSFDTDLAFQLFNAANMYEMCQLKAKCLRYLKSSINETNVMQILMFANAQNDQEVKSFVYDFINSNPTSVLESTELKGIMKSHNLHLPENLQEIHMDENVIK